MSVIDTLIHDRTRADVDRWEALKKKDFDAMTASEQAEWSSGMKGAYNVTDLNRVGEAVAYVAGLLTGLGYAVSVSPKTDWTMEDIPTPAQLAAYLADIAALRRVLAVLPETPEAPADIGGLTYSQANDIEKILADVDRQIRTMETTFVPCGDALCGGDYL